MSYAPQNLSGVCVHDPIRLYACTRGYDVLATLRFAWWPAARSICVLTGRVPQEANPGGRLLMVPVILTPPQFAKGVTLCARCLAAACNCSCGWRRAGRSTREGRRTTYGPDRCNCLSPARVSQPLPGLLQSRCWSSQIPKVRDCVWCIVPTASHATGSGPLRRALHSTCRGCAGEAHLHPTQEAVNSCFSAATTCDIITMCNVDWREMEVLTVPVLCGWPVCLQD